MDIKIQSLLAGLLGAIAICIITPIFGYIIKPIVDSNSKIGSTLFKKYVYYFGTGYWLYIIIPLLWILYRSAIAFW